MRDEPDHGDRDDEAPEIINQLGDVAGVAFQTGVNHGGIHVHLSGNERPPLRQLAPPPPAFTNQKPVLRRLNDAVAAHADRPGPAVAVVRGVAGVGKTAVALTWLHRRRAEFDGDLQVDLADDPHGDSPNDVLAHLLRLLGHDPKALPATLEQRAALYRSLTRGRRLALLIDNASLPGQVRPLLPGGDDSVVVVTARSAMEGLRTNGAVLIDLEPLEDSAAHELLGRLIGEGRVSAEPAEAQEVVALCGGLPIALCVVGVLLAERDHWSLSRMVRRLADESRRLERLAVPGDLSVQAVFETSYRQLAEHAARVFRAFGRHPGDGEIGQEALAALLGVDSEDDDLVEALEELRGARLVDEPVPGRFGMHSLVRLHARWVADKHQESDDDSVALDRLLVYYLEKTIQADRVMMPSRPRLNSLYRQLPWAEFDETAAWAWLETERANLRAAVRLAHQSGRHVLAWQLCEALWTVFFHGKFFEDWITTHEAGIESARWCGDRRAEGRLTYQLGFAYHLSERYDQAEELFARALGLCREAGDREGQATSVESLGLVLLAKKDPKAVSVLTENLSQAMEIDEPRRTALAHHHLGRALSMVDRRDEAMEHLALAEKGLSSLPDPAAEGAVRPDTYNLGRVAISTAQALLRAGWFPEAADQARRGLEIMTELGRPFHQAEALDVLGQAALAAGDRDAARQHLRDALTIYEAWHFPQAEALHRRLSELD
ncbi:tetratricopeptide repeat protein [Streptoalloteichus hindustanus]|uniref:Tetratricopeptide repeat-containing protein n=1 Tax=Streptoalloteichus hindustanus TaxID=2017 RepID=A0A1M4XL95_STRHI|nr:tetratricopeptide repeat protein [Streptoalloteichus hindustanus]SHE94357.1 Tetratricopeptide repeat-containing protein [Streptoalloteichus hindustanus]